MFNLPSPRPYRMERAPLAQAIAQVRFPLVASASTLSGIAAFQERLKPFLPYLGRVQEHEVAVLIGPTGPAAPAGTTTTSAWRFTNDDGWSLSLEPGSATLAVGSGYQDADHFAHQLSDVAKALVETLDIQRCDRLGVRYVDLIDLGAAGADRAWTRWFRPELLGWLGEQLLQPTATMVAHVTHSQLIAPAAGVFAGWPEPVQAIIRHGIVPAGTVIPLSPMSPAVQLPQAHFLLDQDMFVEGRQPLNPDRIVEQFRVLHSQIDGFFRWTLTPEGERQFKVVER